MVLSLHEKSDVDQLVPDEMNGIQDYVVVESHMEELAR